MKRPLHPNRWFLLVAAVIGFLYSYGQCQPDTTIKKSGYYPDQLDTCYLEEDYYFTLQILALKDTQVVFGGQNVTAQIDSIHITDVLGLPSGFQYACNPSRCVFTWKKVGCAKLTGKATASQLGVYPLKFAFVAYARVFGIRQEVNDTIRDFSLVIADRNAVGVEPDAAHTISIYPNPSAGIFHVTGTKNGSVIEIYTANGILMGRGQVQNGQVDLSDFKAGLYFLQLRNELGIKVGKVILQSD